MSKSITSIALLSVFVLTGCDGTKQVLGLKREQHDEFNVSPNAPLTVPPNVGELPKPVPGARRPGEQTPQEKAQSILIKKPQGRKRHTHAERFQNQGSSAESALLKRAGAEKTDPAIREKLTRESKPDAVTEGAEFVRKILPMQKKQSGKVINPYEETRKTAEKSEQG